jgi:ferredoxin
MDVQVDIKCGADLQSVKIRRGLGFQAVSAKYKTGIEYDCRASDCGICAIKILSGQECLSPKTAAEADFLKAMAADDDERLACQTRILGDVKIMVDYL